MPPVITTRNIVGKLQMRHILSHVLLARYHKLVQLNIRFYRTGMLPTHPRDLALPFLHK